MNIEHLGQQSEILRVSYVQEYNELCQSLITLQRQEKEIAQKIEQVFQSLSEARGKCLAMNMIQTKINEALQE